MGPVIPSRLCPDHLLALLYDLGVWPEARREAGAAKPRLYLRDPHKALSGDLAAAAREHRDQLCQLLEGTAQNSAGSAFSRGPRASVLLLHLLQRGARPGVADGLLTVEASDRLGAGERGACVELQAELEQLLGGGEALQAALDAHRTRVGGWLPAAAFVALEPVQAPPKASPPPPRPAEQGAPGPGGPPGPVGRLAQAAEHLARLAARGCRLAERGGALTGWAEEGVQLTEAEKAANTELLPELLALLRQRSNTPERSLVGSPGSYKIAERMWSKGSARGSGPQQSTGSVYVSRRDPFEGRWTPLHSCGFPLQLCQACGALACQAPGHEHRRPCRGCGQDRCFLYRAPRHRCPQGCWLCSGWGEECTCPKSTSTTEPRSAA